MLNDTAKLRRIREAMNVALAEIGAIEDISFEIGNMGYDADGKKCKMTMTMYTGTEKKCKSQRDLESIGRVNLYPPSKLPTAILSEDIGKKFTVDGQTFTLVGWMSRGRKYNWIGKDSNGSTYKFADATLFPFAEKWRK